MTGARRVTRPSITVRMHVTSWASARHMRRTTLRIPTQGFPARRRWRSGCKPDSPGPGAPCGTTSARSEPSTTPPRCRSSTIGSSPRSTRWPSGSTPRCRPGRGEPPPSRRVGAARGLSRTLRRTSNRRPRRTLAPGRPGSALAVLGGEGACSPRSCGVCFRVKVEGRENIPRRGPVILASNHRSFLDSIFLPLVLRRRVTFVAKAEYFDDPKTAWFFRGVGQIPIRREGGSASERGARVGHRRAARRRRVRHLPRGHAHRVTGTCTAATPASRGSRCAPARRSCRSG